MIIYFLPLIAVALLCVPFIFTAKKLKTGKACKRAFIGNLCSFGGVMLIALILPIGNLVSAASEEGAAVALTTGDGLGYLAAALAVGLACIGSGIAVAAGAPAAIGAVSEDPKAFVKALIFVVLGEGIALYGLLIAILIISGVQQ
ncbi:ATP synthase subunit C [Ruminococcus sp. FC2018]|uniref:ATP synthase subunit C n=1 Tax=Ruminococcus sp. FC2018 TaxID=1410617 RepID=UPI00048E0E1D|nr:ATP synthase subunit C [Ruminococcus sp. FC2018]